MPRTRALKPGFFQNDVLADVEPLGRLLFAGLWTLADRAGRLEDRPRRIKAELLPYDECDVERLLEALACRGFIARYEHGGRALIQVVTFARHQNPHVREPASTVLAPCEHCAGIGTARDGHRSGPADPDPDPDPDPDSVRRARAPAREGRA